MKLTSFVATAALLSLATASQAQLMITGVMDGDISGQPTVIEIKNISSSAVNLSGYYLMFYTNGSSSVGSNYQLSGAVASLPAGEFVVIHGTQATFDTAYPSVPSNVHEAYWGSCTVNGDDAIAIGTANDGSANIDVYGVIGVNGDNEDWDYTDSLATRTSGPATTTWTSSQWNVRARAYLDGFTAAQHGSEMPLGTNSSLPVEMDYFMVD